MSESKFKIGDRVHSHGPGWGTVKAIDDHDKKNGYSIGVRFDLYSDGTVTNWFTRDGRFQKSWEPTLLTKEEAYKQGIVYFPSVVETPVTVYRWEKILDQKENQPPYTKENQIVIQQSSYLAPKGSWLERDGWTIVPGSERKIDSKTLKDVPNETL